MSERNIFSQPAYILHQRAYRESSLILEVLTQDYGRLALLAKGVRRPKSKILGVLRPFACILLSFIPKANLKLFTDAEIVATPAEISGLKLYSGFYLNELLCQFLHPDDPHPEVFAAYHSCLQQLAGTDNPETALRRFEFSLLESIGYGINLRYDGQAGKPIVANLRYAYNKEFGLMQDTEGAFVGSSLLAMAENKFDSPIVLNQAKVLMRQVIESHLQGKELKSRTVANAVLKRL